MTKQRIISVDIGNTNTHVALVDAAKRRCLAVDIFPTKDIEKQFEPSLQTVSPEYKNTPIIICSVVQSVNDQVSCILNKNTLSPRWFAWHENFPITVHYENKTVLGKDRLANCLYGHYAYPQKNQILIDIGTALKIDFLKNGNEFMGGTILPGIGTQFKSLHDNTQALPLLPSDQSTKIEFPGTSTESCMQSGVLLGAVGALSYIVEQYKNLYGSDCVVLATGGSWKYVEHLVPFEFISVPHLTIIGTALYGDNLLR